MSKPQDLVQGTLDLLLLKILALEPMNGHAISQRLRQVSGDVLPANDRAPHQRQLVEPVFEAHGVLLRDSPLRRVRD